MLFCVGERNENVSRGARSRLPEHGTLFRGTIFHRTYDDAGWSEPHCSRAASKSRRFGPIRHFARIAEALEIVRCSELTGRDGNRLSDGQARAACAATLLRWLYAVVTTRRMWDARIAAGAISARRGAVTTAAAA